MQKIYPLQNREIKPINSLPLEHCCDTMMHRDKGQSSYCNVMWCCLHHLTPSVTHFVNIAVYLAPRFNSYGLSSHLVKTTDFGQFSSQPWILELLLSAYIMVLSGQSTASYFADSLLVIFLKIYTIGLALLDLELTTWPTPIFNPTVFSSWAFGCAHLVEISDITILTHLILNKSYLWPIMWIISLASVSGSNWLVFWGSISM